MQNTRTSLNRETANAKSNKLDKSSNRQPLQEIQNIPSRLNEIRMFSLNTNENDLLKNQNTKEENYEENPCTPPLYTPKTENSKSESADSNSISKQYEKSKLVYEDYLRDLNKANDLDNHLNKSFSKFGLQRKSDIDNFCYSKRVTHEFLPVSLKNNSNYKKKLIKFIRRSELNEFKTDSNRQLDYFKNSYKFSTFFNFRW